MESLLSKRLNESLVRGCGEGEQSVGMRAASQDGFLENMSADKPNLVWG